MSEIGFDAAHAYLTALQPVREEVQTEMERLAEERRFPIVGPLVGRLLEVLARAIGARRVFELGSGYGYSALHFARAVGDGGEVFCTDLSADNERMAAAFLGRAGLWPRVRFMREEALAALERVGGSFDIIYNDIDKEGYPATVEPAYRHLRPGGLFITDNLLWHGRVLSTAADDGRAATAGVRAFTRALLDHPGFLTTILPLRDGVAVALKVGQA